MYMVKDGRRASIITEPLRYLSAPTFSQSGLIKNGSWSYAKMTLIRNDLFNEQLQIDPHAFWAKFRREFPAPLVWSQQLAGWIVCSHSTAIEIFTNRQLTTDIYGRFRPSPVPLPSSFELEDEQNRHVRRMVASYLAKPNALLESVIIDSCRTLLSSLPIGEQFDFVTGFADPLADLLVEGWLGVSSHTRRNLAELLRISKFDGEQYRRRAAGEIFIEQLLKEIAERRNHRTNDLLSNLAVVWDGLGGNDNDLVAFIAPLIFSLVQRNGTRLITHTVLSICDRPELQVRILDGGYEAARRASIESARLEPITQVVPRRAKESVFVGGQLVGKGDNVFVVLTAVCRDSEFHPEPNCFNLDRAERSLAFGYGYHSCLGQELAVTVSAIALTHLLKISKLIAYDSSSMPEFEVEFGRACTKLNILLL